MSSDELNTSFIKIQGELRSFLLRMTANVQDAEDILQETYLKANANIATFRGDSSIKTWIFAIAANLARDLLKSRKRWPEHAIDICKDAAVQDSKFFREALHIRQTSPQGNFEIKEHIALCFTCISKSLPLEQQLVLWLKEVYRFKVSEIAKIIDQTEAMVKYFLHVARSRMIAVFDHRCTLINKQGICHQCTELNGIFNPKQKEQEALAQIELARAAADKNKKELFALRMKILRSLHPFTSGAAELQLHHLEFNRKVIEQYLNKIP